MSRPFVRQPVVLALLLQAAFADAAPRQDAAGDLAGMPLESLMDVTVVTSASRFAQRISDAPSAVSVLTSQDVREHGWRTLAEALASLPGLYVSDDRNYTYLGARGFQRPGDYNGRFLLLIDGARVNDSVYDQASIGTEGLLDMDLVERIEYVPGPGAAVYGSNTVFGVISVTTKSGSALAGPRAALAAGSKGERRGRASWGYHAQDGTDVLLSVSGFTRDGGDLYAAEFDTPEQNHGIAAGLDYDRSRSAFVKAARGPLSFSAGHVTRVKGIPTASFGAVFNLPNHTRDGQSFASVGYSAPLSEDLSLSARLEWGRMDYLGIGTYPDEAGTPRINVDGAHGAWHGANATATYTGLAGHRLLAGVEVQRNTRRDQYNFNRDPYEPAMDDRRADSRAGIFVEDEAHLAQDLILNAGVRYDRDSTTGGRVNPRVALIWHAGPKDTLKLIHGTAYRSPNAYELYYNVGAYAVVNPELRAEEIATSELVWERRPDAYSKLTVAAFHYRIDGLITETLRPDGILMFDNTEHASADGIELSGERLFAGGTRVRGSYTYQRAADEKDEWLVNSPRHLLKLNATWALPGDALRLGTEGQCTSRRRTENAVTGGFCTWNVTLGPASRNGKLDWSVSLYNAAGRRYGDPAGPAFVQEAIPREGRTVLVKLGHAF
ncbi:TonB-dependent receptor plug domain-containing protein [Pseudoduganella umbonata]|uniref:Iron complex outermembrane receptor protein n=1 Tax=Pseudoduganella umbonata TaxID=864828 RepID=A0A4P8HMD0_9BURK|nr:TonB-dependent receptor [Pseudoduganella umbonata]MBB3219493.1 iron complex outermembrane receptor protein [Pseudoduganella umbonata]QCP09574.1 TonB-dependent receptor [Pseudoduganella umbonata]